MASLIFSRMIWQASKTIVDGSNCIVLTTLLPTTLIFSERVAILSSLFYGRQKMIMMKTMMKMISGMLLAVYCLVLMFLASWGRKKPAKKKRRHCQEQSQTWEKIRGRHREWEKEESSTWPPSWKQDRQKKEREKNKKQKNKLFGGGGDYNLLWNRVEYSKLLLFETRNPIRKKISELSPSGG